MKTSAGPVPSQVLSAELWFRDGLSAGGGDWALRSTALGGGGAYKRWDLQLAVAFVLTSDCGSSHGTQLMPMRICEQRESLVPSILFDFLSLTQAFTVAPSAMRPSSVTKLMVVTQPGTFQSSKGKKPFSLHTACSWAFAYDNRKWTNRQ